MSSPCKKRPDCAGSILDPAVQLVSEVSASNFADISEGRDALEILPAEMWKRVFDCLYSPKSGHSEKTNNKEMSQLVGSDLLTCSRVCKDFQGMLKSTQALWLFKEVFPLIFPRLNLNQVLACREVCKEWSRAVDNLLHDMTSFCPIDEIPPLRKRFVGSLGSQDIMKSMRLMYLFYNTTDLNEFTDFFSNTHAGSKRSPFIIPTVRFEEFEPEAETGYETLQVLLSNYGGHIKEITLELFAEMAVEDYSRKVNQYMDLLPNVKWLDIYGSLPLYECQDILPQSRTVKLPPQLRSFCMEFDNVKRDVPLEARFLSLNFENITCLNLAVADEFLWPPGVKAGFPKLRELGILTFEYGLDLAETFLSQLQASDCPPKLLKLALGTHVFKDDTTDRLLAMINQFGGTLRSFELIGDELQNSMWCWKDVKEPVVHCKLVCPLVSSVKIKDFPHLPLSFLLDLAQSLEELQIETYREYDIRYHSYFNEVVNLYEHVEADVYKSNIWELLSHLQFVEILMCSEDNDVDGHPLYYEVFHRKYLLTNNAGPKNSEDAAELI